MWTPVDILGMPQRMFTDLTVPFPTMSQSNMAPGSAASTRSRGTRRRRSFKEDADVTLLRETLTPGSRAAANTPRHHTPRTPHTRPRGIDTPGVAFTPRASALGSLAGTGISDDRPRSIGRMRSPAAPAFTSRSVFDASRGTPVHPAVAQANQELCVTVFGFPSNFAEDVYRYFAKNDSVVQHAQAGSNAMHLRFLSLEAAKRALQRNGSSQIVKGSFLGIVPCEDQQFRSGTGGATVMSAGGVSTASFITKGGGDGGAKGPSKPSSSGARVPWCCLCCSPADRAAAVGARRRQGWLGWLARLQDVLCSM